MARARTRKVNLKDGFYIEVSNRLGGSLIKLSRDTKAEVVMLMKQHMKSKNVKYLGQFKDNTCIDDKL